CGVRRGRVRHRTRGRRSRGQRTHRPRTTAAPCGRGSPDQRGGGRLMGPGTPDDPGDGPSSGDTLPETAADPITLPAATPLPDAATGAEPPLSPTRPRASTPLVVLATLAIGYTLWAAQDVILPILLAVFFALIGNPLI